MVTNVLPPDVDPNSFQLSALYTAPVLGGKMNTSHIDLIGANLSDKAVIYLNCGDFYIIQGSHDFKIYIYLNTPSQLVTDYSITSLKEFSLKKGIPLEYKEKNPGLPMVEIIHTPTTWRSNVINFLTSNGIKIDIETIMTKHEYIDYINNFVMPVVSVLRK